MNNDMSSGVDEIGTVGNQFIVIGLPHLDSNKYRLPGKASEFKKR